VKKAVVSLAAVVVFFGAIEIGLRCADYQGAPAPRDFLFREIAELHGEPDSVLFWRLPNVRPHFSGFAPKVVVLSDSVTVMDHGRGWPDLLVDALREDGQKRPVDVFNAGVPSYTSWQGLLYFQRDLARERPNIVVVEYGWNDHWPTEFGRPDKEIRLPPPRLYALQQDLARSRFYRLLRTWLIRQPKRDHAVRVALPDYRDNLRRIAEAVRAAGGRPVFATAVYLDGDWEHRDLHRAYVEATKRAAADAGAALIDAVLLFRDRPDLFLHPATDPMHINRDGSWAMAREAARVLVGKGLLP